MQVKPNTDKQIPCLVSRLVTQTASGSLHTISITLVDRFCFREFQGGTYHTNWHYFDVTMDAIASQITSLTIVYSTVYSDADQRKHQSSASLAFVRGIHRGTVNSPHKWPATRKMFPFDYVIMESVGMVLKYLLWNCLQIYAVAPYRWKVNSGSGYGLVQSDNKPLPEPILAQIRSISPHGVTRPQWVRYTLCLEKTYLFKYRASSANVIMRMEICKPLCPGCGDYVNTYDVYCIEMHLYIW